MRIECKNCKETKTENDFRYTIKKDKVYFQTTKCKECLTNGKRPYQYKVEKKLDLTKLFIDESLKRNELDETTRKQLHYLLLKIKMNDGNVTELDCFNIISLYVDIYGNVNTVKNESLQLENELEILYYYKKLQDVYERARVVETV